MWVIALIVGALVLVGAVLLVWKLSIKNEEPTDAKYHIGDAIFIGDPAFLIGATLELTNG